MSTFRTLTDVEKRLVQAVSEMRESPNTVTIRGLVRKYDLKRTKLQRALATDGTPQSILALSDGRGRRNRLSSDEEKMVCDVAQEFAKNGTPLSRNCLLDVAQALVQSFPIQRRNTIGFKDDRPGASWLKLFLSRHPNLELKTRSNLERVRAEAMNPATVAKHFARIASLCEYYEITDGSQVFNIDESGFSLRGMRVGGKSKCVVPRNSRSNSRSVSFTGSIDHVTLMPVVSKSGQIFTPVCVLPGTEAKYRRLQNGRYETPADFATTRSVTSLMENSNDTEVRIENYHQLYELFCKRAEKLRSDGAVVLESGTIRVSTTTGASLTSDNVLSALKAAKEKKERDVREKEQRATERERKRAEKVIEQLKNQEKRDASEEQALSKLLVSRKRGPMRDHLNETRLVSRRRAFLRSWHPPSVFYFD